MKHYFLISFLALLISINELQAQESISLHYESMVVIPNNYRLDDTTVGGLSAISFNINDSTYYIVADKSPSRIYKVDIKFMDELKVEFQSVVKLNPPLLSDSELEGIAINGSPNEIYVSDEQSEGTRIFMVDKKGRFIKLIEPINSPFLPLSGHNSGIEGLTLSNNGDFLYYAFERPTEDCLEESNVLINRIELNHQTNKVSYHYQTHEVEGDEINTNGISEILYLNDSNLLIMERAYIPGKGNIVRLYQTYLSKDNKSISCSKTPVFKTTSNLVFDFANVQDFEIDNAEGMTFNKDNNRLIIVTDNNFNKRQETQIIVLNVTY